MNKKAHHELGTVIYTVIGSILLFFGLFLKKIYYAIFKKK